MEKYKCLQCDKIFRAEKGVRFCPYCQSDQVDNVAHYEARKYADDMIAELKVLIPQMNEAYQKYVSFYGRVEFIRVNLRQYKKRGIVSEDEIPVLEKPSLKEELKKYRERRKEVDENVQTRNSD